MEQIPARLCQVDKVRRKVKSQTLPATLLAENPFCPQDFAKA